MNSVPATETSALSSLSRGVAVVRMVDPDMKAQTLATLLWISQHQGKNIEEMRTALGLTSSSASRAIARLLDTERPGRPGLNFVTSFDNPDDRREKLLMLTPKGVAFMQRLAKAI